MPPAKPPTVQRGLLLRVLVLLGQHDLLWKRKTGQGEPQAPHGPAPAPAVGAAGARPSATHLAPVPPTSPQRHPPHPSATPLQSLQRNSRLRDVFLVFLSPRPSCTGGGFQTNPFPPELPPHSHPLPVLRPTLIPPRLFWTPRTFLQTRQDHKSPQAPGRSLMPIHAGDSLGMMLHTHRCSFVSKKPGLSHGEQSGGTG